MDGMNWPEIKATDRIRADLQVAERNVARLKKELQEAVREEIAAGEMPEDTAQCSH